MHRRDAENHPWGKNHPWDAHLMCHCRLPDFAISSSKVLGVPRIKWSRGMRSASYEIRKRRHGGLQEIFQEYEMLRLQRKTRLFQAWFRWNLAAFLQRSTFWKMYKALRLSFLLRLPRKARILVAPKANAACGQHRKRASGHSFRRRLPSQLVKMSEA